MSEQERALLKAWFELSNAAVVLLTSLVGLLLLLLKLVGEQIPGKKKSFV